MLLLQKENKINRINHMKIITLIPVKNEAWILEDTLNNLSSFSDHIIIADQSSSDNTLGICKKFEKVVVIKNENIGHSNIIRWTLLDEARKIDGENLIFCIDADEIISPKVIQKIKELISDLKLKPGVGFSFSWIQIFGSFKNHRVDGVWKDNIKAVAFWDDRKIDYKREFVINDHTSRIPEVKDIYYIKEYPLLHLQSLSEEKSDIKQVWYRCSELIKDPKNYRKINYKYSVADTRGIVFEKTKEDWFEGLNQVDFKYNKNNDWHYVEILGWFDKYGIEFFEPLDIWNIVELKGLFVKNIGREPKPKAYPPLLVELNNVKNKVKYIIQKYV